MGIEPLCGSGTIMLSMHDCCVLVGRRMSSQFKWRLSATPA